MTYEKSEEVLAKYKLLLKDNPPVKFESELKPSFEDAMSHCAWMIGEMEKMLEVYESRKFNRWLGFMQGVFFASNVFSINQMRDHNRSEE